VEAMLGPGSLRSRGLGALGLLPWALCGHARAGPGRRVPKEDDGLGLLQLGVDISLPGQDPGVLGPWAPAPLSLAQVATRTPDTDTLLSSLLAGFLALFLLVSLVEFNQFRLLARLERPKAEAAPRKVAPRPLLVILGLTFYRFYTGFMSATWLPYLLAMEGAELWRENQAMFMGLVKLLYGLSILLNPLFGLLGDRAASVSYAAGRRLFVRMGIILAGLGIYCCHFAAPRGLFKTFFLGIITWRLGEGLNDVTTEAICPEMLPPEQFEISSAIRASMFLLGGLSGYVMVALLAHVHYSWLYHGYLIMMLLCGLPALLLIDGDAPAAPVSARRQGSFLASAVEAYVRPSRFQGGFPRACLCIFLFSCGTAPMFFILLMIRDLVGIEEPLQLQRHFSLVSIVFFLSAAIAAALNALAAPPKPKRVVDRQTEVRAQSFHMTATSVVAFGVVCIMIPFLRIFHDVPTRTRVFYVVASFMGATFGSVFSRFQDCNWQLLPPGVETANAMGYSTMWKLLGAGLGNFGAGLVLDLFQYDHRTASIGHHATSAGSGSTLVAYRFAGYLAMCLSSAGFVLVSAMLVLTLPRIAAEGMEKSPESATPRASPADEHPPGSKTCKG